jgi:hypothetical protein
MRLVFTILGLPPLNQFDATAPLPLDAFTSLADTRPFTARAPDLRLFDAQAAFKPFHRQFNWRHFAETARMDDPEDMTRAFADADDALSSVVRGTGGRHR